MANGNPYTVAVPSLYEALQAGEAGYKGMRDMQSQRAMQDARQQAAGAVSGGDTRSAMARLLGVGDVQGASVLATMDQHRATQDIARQNLDLSRTREARADEIARGNLDVARGNLAVNQATAQRRDAPTFGEVYDESGQPQKAMISRDGSYQPIGGAKAKAKDLPFNVIKELGDRGTTFGDFTRLTGTFSDVYGGYKFERAGDTANWAARNFGVGNQDAAQWWQDYQNQKNLVRNQLFGSALTTTEKAEFDKANINPGMTPDAIKSNLTRQHDATRRAAAKLANVYVQMG
jgi:hypothetical protein